MCGNRKDSDVQVWSWLRIFKLKSTLKYFKVYFTYCRDHLVTITHNGAELCDPPVRLPSNSPRQKIYLQYAQLASLPNTESQSNLSATYLHTMAAPAEAPGSEAYQNELPGTESMQYVAQGDTKPTSKIKSVAESIGFIACLPCYFCTIACICCLVGDSGTFLDGPFCNDCVPNMVQDRVKRMWRKYGKKG
jgi:hypothetical protein